MEKENKDIKYSEEDLYFLKMSILAVKNMNIEEKDESQKRAA